MAGRLGIDVGETFTDLLLVDDSTGATHAIKTPSTPDDPSVGIVAGLQKLISEAALTPSDIETVVHGSSIPAKAKPSADNARVGLLVTAGFEQVLHLARSKTPAPLNGWVSMTKPDPPAALELTRGLKERIDARGDVHAALDEAHARAMIRELIDARVEAISVSLLHSHANSAHEQRIRSLIREYDDELPVTLSSETVPEIGDYERTLVTAMNDQMRPRMRLDLEHLRRTLSDLGVVTDARVARADGGAMSVDHATELPVMSIRSGPAGAVSGAAFVASLAGAPDALSLEIGGTSANVAVIRDGRPVLSPRTKSGGVTVRIPTVDVWSVGGGGGSIASVSATGGFRVGPRGAGTDPGPACYGRGGEQPTVTDASLVLGHLPSALSDGAIALESTAAEEAIARIARPLGHDVSEAAQGIIDVFNEATSEALRLAAVRNGLDPHELPLVASGGAGPLHGNAIGRLLGSFPVIVPPAAGVMSALGFLSSEIRAEFPKSYARDIDDAEPREVTAILSGLGEKAKRWLDAEGVDAGDQALHYEADVRYRSLGHAMTLELKPDGLTNGGLGDLSDRFGSAHQRHHGSRLSAPVQLVTLRAVAIGRRAGPSIPKSERVGDDASTAIVDERRIYIDGGFETAHFYDRARLGPGNRVHGAAVIVQKDSTTVIHPGYVGEVDEYLNILIAPAGGHA